jgi:MFS family permease
MITALVGMFVVCIDLLVLNHRGDDSPWWLVGLLPVLAVAVATESGFTPAALAYLADITEDFQADRGVIMGLYSIFLSVGEVAGGVAGGPFAQAWGLDGMIFLTLILAGASMVTVLLLRRADAAHTVPSPTGGRMDQALRSAGAQ